MMMRAVLAVLLGLWLWAGSALAEPVRVTFLHVNDIYQYHPVDGRGGLAELLTLIERRRAEAPNPLFTFGGDLLSPSLASTVTRGAHMIDLLNRMSPVAAVPGNHEFDFGAEVFAERIAESQFPWIADNIVGEDGRPWGGLVGSRIVETGGIKVGYLGILTHDTAALSVVQGVRFTDEIAAASRAAAALRAQGADIVVALTHLDFEFDRRLAQAVPEIDLILGGHDHDPVSIQEGAGALILKAGQDAQWLGEVVMEVEPGGSDCTCGPPHRARPESWRFVAVRDLPPSEGLEPLITATDRLLGTALEQPLATLETPLDSRTKLVRSEETAIGNLVADALRAHFGAELALINGGGLRGNRAYEAGTVLTRRDVLSEMPFGNIVMLLGASGAQITAILEHALSGVEAKAGRFPQVSGLAVTYDPSREPGGRLVSVSVGGRKLDPARTYRLATTDFLARGGDGFAMLKTLPVLVDAKGGPLLSATVIDYLAAHPRIAPRVEGRTSPMGR
jgi:2',3'-cyclic-nucleotide 2'-phosphodiesterase (5'-nucleotidase family)